MIYYKLHHTNQALLFDKERYSRIDGVLKEENGTLYLWFSLTREWWKIYKHPELGHYARYEGGGARVVIRHKGEEIPRTEITIEEAELIIFEAGNK